MWSEYGDDEIKETDPYCLKITPITTVLKTSFGSDGLPSLMRSLISSGFQTFAYRSQGIGSKEPRKITTPRHVE